MRINYLLPYPLSLAYLINDCRQTIINVNFLTLSPLPGEMQTKTMKYSLKREWADGIVFAPEDKSSVISGTG